MTCREFEDAMQAQFGSADETQWRDWVIAEKWSELPRSAYVDHLSDCSDCVQSLLHFFEIRNIVDYQSQPCFHVAYYSADVPDRCLERDLGMYSITTDRGTRESIVIGFCPWCGIDLPVRA